MSRCSAFYYEDYRLACPAYSRTMTHVTLSVYGADPSHLVRVHASRPTGSTCHRRAHLGTEESPAVGGELVDVAVRAVFGLLWTDHGRAVSTREASTNLVHPEVEHHRADPAPDVLLLHRVVPSRWTKVPHRRRAFTSPSPMIQRRRRRERTRFLGTSSEACRAVRAFKLLNPVADELLSQWCSLTLLLPYPFDGSFSCGCPPVARCHRHAWFLLP